MSKPVPLHGFVLAGGKSSRMGQDKALLQFRGRPMVEIGVEKLRSFCADVSIVGDRADLEGFAPLVRDEREGAGPAGGIEAALRASAQRWAMFMPVDVPLVPAELLRAWAEKVIEGDQRGSYLVAAGRVQPAFCLLPKAAYDLWRVGLDEGERRLEVLLRRAGALERSAEAARGATTAQVRRWFANVNTPQDLAHAERGET